MTKDELNALAAFTLGIIAGFVIAALPVPERLKGNRRG